MSSDAAKLTESNVRVTFVNGARLPRTPPARSSAHGLSVVARVGLGTLSERTPHGGGADAEERSSATEAQRPARRIQKIRLMQAIAESRKVQGAGPPAPRRVVEKCVQSLPFESGSPQVDVSDRDPTPPRNRVGRQAIEGEQHDSTALGHTLFGRRRADPALQRVPVLAGTRLRVRGFLRRARLAVANVCRGRMTTVVLLHVASRVRIPEPS
jgi:hypothetical protein